MDKQNRSSRLPAVVLGCILSLAAQSAAADVTLACHVVTERGQPDVVFVQTADGRTAHKVAQRAMLDTGRREREQVVEVVQCINFPKQRFSSAAIQAYAEKLPR